MTTHPDANVLAAYAERRLAQKERRRVLCHIADCDRCRRIALLAASTDEGASLQRISRARRTAKKEDRTIADGEVVTACQSACPTRAITFGNLNDRNSAAKNLKNDPRNYALLGHLDTRPRTTYLADLRNPNGALKGERS